MLRVEAEPEGGPVQLASPALIPVLVLDPHYLAHEEYSSFPDFLAAAVVLKQELVAVHVHRMNLIPASPDLVVQAAVGVPSAGPVAVPALSVPASTHTFASDVVSVEPHSVASAVPSFAVDDRDLRPFPPAVGHPYHPHHLFA